jgi:hypothetical protein
MGALSEQLFVVFTFICDHDTSPCERPEVTVGQIQKRQQYFHTFFFIAESRLSRGKNTTPDLTFFVEGILIYTKFTIGNTSCQRGTAW